MTSTLFKDEPEDLVFEEEFYPGTKCGNIFFTGDRKYTFICEFCEEPFDGMIQFGVHLEAKHFIGNVYSEIEHQGNQQIKSEINDSPLNEGVDPSQAMKQNSKDESEPNAVKSDKPAVEEAATEDSEITCEFCKISFKLQHHFRTHVVFIHGNSLPKVLQNDPTYLTCDRCNQLFETPLERHQHELMHNSDDLYHCPHCPKTVSSRGTRRSHTLIHNDIRPYSCPHCSLTFRTRSNLLWHVRVHVGVKSFPCKNCGKRFKTINNRDEHSSIHTNEKPYECEECGAQFRLKSSLRQHLHHHSDKRYKCEQCGKECISARKLKSHLVKHSDERPYVCSECQATFKYPTSLKKHLKIHEKQKSENGSGQKLDDV